MAKSTLREFLSSNIYGLIGEELKTDTDLFRKIVKLPHHTFSANPQDEIDIELKANRLKQRWNRLANGKRQNPNDVKFEEAIRSYINTELKESDEKKKQGIHMVIEALRKSHPNKNYKGHINPTSFNLEQTNNFKIKSQSHVDLLNALQRANTMYLVCEETFATYLFSSSETSEISKYIWDAIIFNRNPHLRIYVPDGEGKLIWDTIEYHLRYFLLRIAKIDPTNPEYQSNEIDSYLQNLSVKQFLKATKEDKKEKAKVAISEILKGANSKSNIDSDGRYRILIRENKLTKMFATPYLILDPSLGEPSMFTLCRQPNELVVMRWQNANIDIWKKYDKKYYMQFGNNDKYVTNVFYGAT